MHCERLLNNLDYVHLSLNLHIHHVQIRPSFLKMDPAFSLHLNFNFNLVTFSGSFSFRDKTQREEEEEEGNVDLGLPLTPMGGQKGAPLGADLEFCRRRSQI